jgi:hypothetical protein
LSASIHSTVYRRPTKCRKWASKNTKYGQPWDIRGRRLKAPPDWHFLLAIFTVLLSLAYWPSYWWLKYEKSFLPTFCCFWPSSPPPGHLSENSGEKAGSSNYRRLSSYSVPVNDVGMNELLKFHLKQQSWLLRVFGTAIILKYREIGRRHSRGDWKGKKKLLIQFQKILVQHVETCFLIN